MPSESTSVRGAGASRRGTLNRGLILQTALDLVDTDGIGALTMRRVATKLGVDPMALYRHVKNKDALLDGVVEMLWREIPPPPRRQGEWAETLRSFAYALRGVVKAHPKAAPLLCIRSVFPRPSLEALDTLLRNIQDAGFDDLRAGQLIRTVISTALGDALVAQTYQALTPAPARPQPEPDADAWIALSQALPADTPPELVRSVYTVCACEPDADFAFVLDLILYAAQELKRERQ